MPPTRRYYTTADGGPPLGGRPPGAPPMHNLPPQRHVSAPSQVVRAPLITNPGPPPAYAATPPGPLMVPVAQPMLFPFYAPGPPALVYPLAGEHPYPPGSKLDGLQPRFDNGELYIFPPSHTTFHIVDPRLPFKPWETPGVGFQWRAHRCPTNITVKDLIRQVVQKVGDDESKVGIVEMLEVGDGVWLKGSEFHLDEDKSKQTLAELGWNEERGTTRKPTWLFLLSE